MTTSIKIIYIKSQYKYATSKCYQLVFTIAFKMNYQVVRNAGKNTQETLKIKYHLLIIKK